MVAERRKVFPPNFFMCLLCIVLSEDKRNMTSNTKVIVWGRQANFLESYKEIGSERKKVAYGEKGFQ